MEESNREEQGYFYEEEDLEVLESFIDENFGESSNVFHEIVSPDIHCDIYIIEPTSERNFYTLVTLGMGAREMDVPEEFREYNGGRAEVMITLPAEWNIKSQDEKDYWPLRWLKIVARFPITNDTWLGWGHSIPNGEPFAENTQLSGMLLAGSYLEDGIYYCELPGEDRVVQFYHLIPLYENEMEYKIQHGTDELLEKFGQDFSHVVDIRRPDYCRSE